MIKLIVVKKRQLSNVKTRLYVHMYNVHTYINSYPSVFNILNIPVEVANQFIA